MRALPPTLVALPPLLLAVCLACLVDVPFLVVASWFVSLMLCFPEDFSPPFAFLRFSCVLYCSFPCVMVLPWKTGKYVKRGSVEVVVLFGRCISDAKDRK